MNGQEKNNTLNDRQRKGSEEQKLELVTEYISVVAKAQSSGTGPSTEKRALRSTFSRDIDEKIMKAIRHTFTICWTNSKTASTTTAAHCTTHCHLYRISGRKTELF